VGTEIKSKSAMETKNTMKIKVGSTNEIKVRAVQEILQDYSHLKDAIISAVDVSSGIADQPKSLEDYPRG